MALIFFKRAYFRPDDYRKTVFDIDYDHWKEAEVRVLFIDVDNTLVPYDETGWPLDKRVGQNLAVTLEIFRQFTKKTADRPIVLRGVPRYADVVKNGAGRYLGDPARAVPGGVVMN